LERRWTPGEPGPALFHREIPRHEPVSVRVVLVNGRFDRNLSESGTPSPVTGEGAGGGGLTAKSLRDALMEDEAVVRPWLGQVRPRTTRVVGREIKPDPHTFADLNTAVFEDGLFLRLQGAVEPLIEIVHVSAGEGQAFAPRVLILAEEGSRARIVETYVSDGHGPTFTLPVTEVVVKEGAHLEHVRVQDESDEAFHIANWQSLQAPRSEYHSYNVCYGAALARVDQGIWLDGEGTVTRLDGVVCASGDQHIDNHTRLDHAFPNSNSFEIYKQVVDGRATVVFNGKIFVHQDAQKTDAKQTNQALLLSPTATIDSKPQLEIFADDVKCTHGATVGQLEDLPMFYMRSRGVPKEQAEAVLVYAFAAEVLELITHLGVRQALEKRLYEKLGVDVSA
jgi:Fe-S cluster assembly protein SufD